jgi:3-hydroxyacyl-CoA dehydrogenase/3-hydroxy-2-methylbutyryl-CoA dehydrogenase
MDPADCVVLVTGGASGLGAATVRELAKLGSRVAILDLESSAGADLAAELGDEVIFLAADICDTVQVERAVDQVVERFGRLDVTVNAAGILVMGRTLDRDAVPGSIVDFRRAVEVNLVGTFDVARFSALAMSRKEPGVDGHRGLIINTSSVSGLGGQAGSIGYAASKAAIAGMTLPMARDLSSWGIRVVAIAPGAMETPMLQVSHTVSDPLENVLFPKRAGRPDEYAHLVVCVIENEIINATTIRLDAGSRLTRR